MPAKFPVRLTREGEERKGSGKRTSWECLDALHPLKNKRLTRNRDQEGSQVVAQGVRGVTLSFCCEAVGFGGLTLRGFSSFRRIGWLGHAPCSM
jgi:hypothetical protein